jgi:DNA repair protein RecO
MNASFTTKAIVISRKSQQEKNISLTLLTPNLGKIYAIATGAKSIKSRRQGSLQPGNIINVHLFPKEKFFLITEVETTNSFLLFKKNLIQLNLLFCILEIVRNVSSENEPSLPLFSNIESIILSLQENHLYSFLNNQIKLLNLLGFGIPSGINQNLLDKKYHQVQQQLLNYFESILEKPLFSRKLLLS